jgi:hypothetical protein
MDSVEEYGEIDALKRCLVNEPITAIDEVMLSDLVA